MLCVGSCTITFCGKHRRMVFCQYGIYIVFLAIKLQGVFLATETTSTETPKVCCSESCNLLIHWHGFKVQMYGQSPFMVSVYGQCMDSWLFTCASSNELMYDKYEQLTARHRCRMTARRLCIDGTHSRA